MRGATLVFVSTLIWQLSNFAFNSVSAHLLGPRSYGTLAAVVGILYLASPFFVAVQTIASRATSALKFHGSDERLRPALLHYGRYLAATAIFLGALMALSGSAIARFLRISSATPIAILAIALAVTSVVHLQRGVLQGSSRFGRYAASTSVEALAKIGVSAVILLAVSRTIEGAVVGIAASAAVALVVNAFLLRFLPRPTANAEPRVNLSQYSLPTLTTLLLLAALLSVDILAAKRYLPAHLAGIYSSASLAGKIVYFATSPLTFVLFPTLSARSEGGRSSRKIVACAFAVVLGIAAVIVTAYALAPKLLIRPLFGHHFDDAAPYLWPLAVAFTGYAIIYLAAMSLLARGRSEGIVALAIAVFAQLGGLYAAHGTIREIVTVQVTVLGTSALGLGALALRSRR